MNPNGSRSRVRLLFAHEGAFHTEIVAVPSGLLAQYDRLIDLLREDPEVTRQLYLDVRKLVSASLVDDEDPAEG